jgi:hypothetical protein
VDHLHAVAGLPALLPEPSARVQELLVHDATTVHDDVTDLLDLHQDAPRLGAEDRGEPEHVQQWLELPGAPPVALDAALQLREDALGQPAAVRAEHLPQRKRQRGDLLARQRRGLVLEPREHEVLHQRLEDPHRDTAACANSIG